MQDKNVQQFPSAVSEGGSLESPSEIRITSTPAINTGALPVVPTQKVETPYLRQPSAQPQDYSLKVYKSNSRVRTYIIVAALILLLIGIFLFIYISNKNDSKTTYPSQPLQTQLNNQTNNYSDIQNSTLNVSTKLIVQGTSNLQGDVALDGNLNIVQDLTVQGKTVLNSLEVNGVANINGELRVNGQLIPQSLLNLLSGTTVINNITSVTAGSQPGGNGPLSGDGSNITGIKAINCADCVRLQGSNTSDQVGNIALGGNLRARQTNLRAGINAVDTFTVETATGERIITADTLNRNVTVGNLLPQTSGSATPGNYTAEYTEYVGQTNSIISGVSPGNLSAATGQDGLIRFVYQDQNTSDIVYVRCLNIGCSSAATTIVGSDPVNWTSNPSIALDTSDMAYITYGHGSTNDISILHCSDDDCVSKTVQVNIGDPASSSFARLVIGPDNFARVIIIEEAYDLINDSSVYTAKHIKCMNSSCSLYIETQVLEATDNVYVTEANINASGTLQLLAYDYDLSEYLLLTCSDNDCASYTSETIGGNYTQQLFLDSNYLPKMTQTSEDYATRKKSIELLSCLDTLCATTQTSTIFEGIPALNEDIYLNTYGVYEINGQSVVAYLKTTYNYATSVSTNELRLATCQNPACSSIADQLLTSGEEAQPYELLPGPNNQFSAIYRAYDSDTGTYSLQVRTNMSAAILHPAVIVPAQQISGTSIGDATRRFGQLYGQSINLQTTSSDAALLINKIGITGTLSDGTFLNEATGDLVDLQINGSSVFSIDNVGTLSLSDPSTSNTLFEVQQGSLLFKNNDETDLFSVTQQASTFYSPLIVSPAVDSTVDKFIVGNANASSFRVTADGGVVVGETFSDASNFYEVINDTYVPSTLTSNATVVSGLLDDTISSEIAVPFTVNFYNKKYNSLKIMSDGAVGFDAQYACYPRYTPQYARDYGCRSVIMGVASDLNPDAGGIIRYETLGEAPNRVFVAEFMNVRELGVANGQVSFQIQIFESSNPNVGNKITVQTIDASMEARTYGQGLVSPNGAYLTYIDSRINMQPTFNLVADAISYIPSTKYNQLLTGDLSVENNLSVQGAITANQAVFDTISAPSVKTNKSGVITPGLNMSWYNSDSTNYRTLGSGTLVDQSIDTDAFLINSFPYYSNWPTAVNATYTNTSWTGWFKATKTANSIFQVCGEGGYRMYIDTKRIVNKWSDGGSTCSEGTVYLEESTWYPIRVDYYHGTEANPGIAVKMSTTGSVGDVTFLNFDHGSGSSALDVRLTSATEPGGLVASGTYLSVVGDLGFSGQLQDSSKTGSYLSFNQSQENSGAALISTRTGTNIGLVVQGSASQTNDLLQFKNVSGVTLANIDANGNLAANGALIKPLVNSSTALQIQNASASTTVLAVNTIDLRVEIGSGSDIYLAGAGNTRNAITKTYSCSVSENINDIVIINGVATVGQTTTPDSNRVAGVVVTKPTSNTCTIAIGGSVQVNFGMNPGPVTTGDPVTTSSIAGAAQSNITPPTGSILGNSTSAKDGSNLVWVLIRGN